jgi:hypothetical protein
MAIQAGKYRASCTGPQDATWGISKAGNTQLGLVFKILDEGPSCGWLVSWRGTFTENTVDRVLESLEACGLEPGSELTELQRIDRNEVSITVEIIEGEGENGPFSFPQVQWINRPGAGRVKFHTELTQEDAKAMLRDAGALWRARSADGKRNVGEPRRKQQASPKTSSAVPIDPNHPLNQPAEDDIPF